MANDFLLPTQHLGGGERLLHGMTVASAVAPRRAEDWVKLDADIFRRTLECLAGSSTSSTILIVGCRFDCQEIADWGSAPYWRKADDGTGAGPSSGRPPTASELALGLCHADARVRAAVLDAVGGEAPLPLLLLRCADGAERVREYARTVFAKALASVDDDSARALTALALRLGGRRHGRWARDTVLARTGGIRAAAVRELLAREGRAGEESRMAGIRAGAESGLLNEDALYQMAMTSKENRERLAGIRAALSLGQDAAARKRFLAFLNACEDSELRVVALRHALAVLLPSTGDLADLAVGHRDRNVRRLAARALLDRPAARTLLDQLLAAPDAAVRGLAVRRLRATGRSEDLVPYLTDPSPWVRGLARCELCAAGGDPHEWYRAVCADPDAVTSAAVSGLAERRDPEDAALLRALTRHTDGGVRARALGGLRRLRALGNNVLIRYADDPDPRVGAVVLRALRDEPAALRALLGHPLARVRARALVHLAQRHTIGWDEALPLLSDPAPEVTRAARGALEAVGREVPVTRLLALAAPGEVPERRALAMHLLGRSFAPEALLNALRLLDDPLPAVRAAARDQAEWVLRDRGTAEGPHADKIRALAERHKARLAAWRSEEGRRRRARRDQ
ncbi:hypothetical protein ACFC0D_01225 [Streptomyces sp. NPDC056222]|uniref:hypothetical protein n=1 Tax=Streptomyces sp. NPDC056222 TaxID=3345749 RepID=UPI0035D5E879